MDFFSFFKKKTSDSNYTISFMETMQMGLVSGVLLVRGFFSLFILVVGYV